MRWNVWTSGSRYVPEGPELVVSDVLPRYSPELLPSIPGGRSFSASHKPAEAGTAMKNKVLI